MGRSFILLGKKTDPDGIIITASIAAFHFHAIRIAITLADVRKRAALVVLPHATHNIQT
jgi:hypothetical protein